MGILQGVVIDIEGTITFGDFEVIDIVDEKNPYPSLLEIDWAIDMNGVINSKKQIMSFERKSLSIVVSMVPAEGSHYTEATHNYEESDDDLDQIYKIIAQDQDWVNFTTGGCIAWDRKSFYTSDLDEELEHWKNRLLEVSTLHCNMTTKLLRCVSSEVISLPYYDGLIDIDKFLDAFEREVFDKHCFQALDLALRATLARW